MNFERKDKPAGPATLLGVILFRGFMGITLLIGLSAAVAGLSLAFRGAPEQRPGAVIAVLMGLFIAGLCIVYFFRCWFSGSHWPARMAAARGGIKGPPWLARKDWAARRIEHTSAGIATGLWIWTAGWFGFLAFIGWVNHDKIVRAMAQSWWNVALLGVFVAAGLAGLALAIWFTRSWLVYGTSILHLDTLPAWLGERFRGALEARLRPLPQHPFEVELACQEVRWITTGSGKNRSTRLDVHPLGSVTATIEPRRFAPTRGGARCALDIEVPGDLPEYDVDDQGNGVRWVLTIASTQSEPAFSCSFEVPVFARP